MVLKKNNELVATEPVVDEQRFQCLIRDLTNVNTSTKFPYSAPGSMMVHTFHTEVAKLIGYKEDSFSLVYERQDGDLISELNAADYHHQTMGELCAGNTAKRNSFMVSDKDGVQPVLEEIPPESTSTAASVGVWSASGTQCTEPPSYESASQYQSGYSYRDAVSYIKSDNDFVGLVNQAMTCYLNSLLQTLFMTPEFRNAVYRWEYDGKDSRMNIPFQLQQLFLQLQTSKKRSVETTDITRSFGWESSEAWQQHDVQELCRVMFDALERAWRKTDQAALINQLYQGSMKDYVKCQECGTESARTDTYLDIPLVIRPFGADRVFSSVSEALDAFVEPELLTDNNQYYCSTCDKKCDAHKGLKFLSFPYILTLQLKRFDFDYVTMHRIKLNDRMEFQELMNLNHLIEDLRNSGEDAESVDRMEDEDDTAAAAAPKDDLMEEEGTIDDGEAGCSASGTSTKGDSSAEAATNVRNAKHSQCKGPFEYELFSIMIHSGSAAGGHYYAYIKSFTDGRWYSFNDQHVTSITNDDIKRTYGGSSYSRGYYSSAYTSSTNAYMLMYRQIDKEQNKAPMSAEDFPVHLKEALQVVNDQEEIERQLREMNSLTCRISTYFVDPVTKKREESRLEIHQDKTLQEATQLCLKNFGQESVPLSCARLVKYDKNLEFIECSLEGEEERAIGELIGGVKTVYTFDLLLEVKKEEETFLEYKIGGVTVRIHQVDLLTEEVSGPVTYRATLSQTVEQLMTEVTNLFPGVSTDKMRCVRDRYQVLREPDKTLKEEGFHKSTNVFFECSGTQEDDNSFFRDTKFYRIIDDYGNRINIQIAIPSKDEVEVFLEAEASVVATPSPDVTLISATAPLPSGDFKPSITTEQKKSPYFSDDPPTYDDAMSSSVVPLTSSALHSGPGGDHSCQIHSYIGEAIYKENLEKSGEAQPVSPESMDKSVDSVSTPSSVSAVTSENASPQQENIQPLVTASDAAENWDLDDNIEGSQHEKNKFFSATLHVDSTTGKNELLACVDKTITLTSLKKELESFIGTTGSNFKVFRLYGNSQEMEIVRQSETLATSANDSKIIVRLGRALRSGEQVVKIHQLLIHEDDPCKFLTDVVLAKGMHVLTAKRIIVKELRKRGLLDIPLERCRLRKYSWKTPTTIYLDTQVFDVDIPMYISNLELFVEFLDVPERKTTKSHLSVYLRHWKPASYELSQFHEIVIDKKEGVEGLKNEINAISGIPVDNLELSKPSGSFPCATSLLEVHDKLDWSAQVSSLYSWPVCEDGSVLFYRDSQEELIEPSEEKKKEILQQDNVRMAKFSAKTSSYSRKERPLKIYTAETPTKTPTTISFSPLSQSSPGPLLQHPDLD